MENNSKTPVVNQILVDKLNSMSTDIKYYLNMNYMISSSLSDENTLAFKFMSNENLNELSEIRKRLKALSTKLEEQIQE